MKKTTLIKKISFFVAFFCTANFGFGQTCIISEDFNRTDNTAIGGSWTEVGGDASIFSNVLRLETGGAIGRDYIYQNVSGVYNTQLNLLSTSISWVFNMRLGRSDPGGFDSNEYGIAFVLGGTSSDFTTGNGYAVVLGENGVIDNIRLVHYTGGIDLNSNLTDIIRGSFDYNNLEHSSIKVTYAPSTNTWELFVRVDGASFADPLTLTAGNSQGTAINTTYTGSNLPFIGAFYNHNSTANDRATFDNILIGPMTTWTSGSWDNGTPTIGTHAVINDYFDTSVSDGIQTSFSACSLTVTNNGILQIGNNTFVEVQNDITVDAGGEISLEPSAAVVQIDDLGTVTNNGNIYVYKETAPMNAWYEYTYWSSPVSGAQIGVALSDSPANRRFKFNGQNFLDHCGETGNNNILVCDDGFGNGVQDDIDDNNNDWQVVASNTVMQPGIGYAATLTEFAYNIAPGNSGKQIRAAAFQGPFNNGVITVPIYRNDFEPNDYNWNFIGNPYPSAIDANLFLSANSNIATDVNGTGYTDGAIFLWSQNTPPSGSTNGNQVLNFSNDDYAIINLVGTNAAGDGLTPSRFIPSGQGFFISMSNSATPISSSTNSDGHTIAQGEIVFNNSMRVKGATDNSQFFKNTNSKEKTNTVAANKIWVDLTSDNGVFNQILVGYVNGATNGDDGISFDTNKFSTKGAVLYSTIEGSNKKFAIQGKDVNSINENETIKLGFRTSITVATLFKLSIAQLEGDFLNNNTIYLKDNLLNKIHNLSASNYTFTSGIGEFNNRFEITFSNKALAVEDVLLNKNVLKIIELDNDYVQFNTSDNLNIKSVHIFDLLGRQLYHFKGETTSETYKLSNLNSSVYIAKVALSNGAVITKKAFKR
ncbi:T9SS type A sorting domain-containing protein [Mariniflexile sp. HNIBRBA6329]|uniref:T9SS type A sorting domain-containing protein n=1 Tax=Mariniflexile sp. HNIBRBA6329 TaxID=3373088 RepID=UPI003746A8BF